MTHVGQVGKEQTVQTGYEAAKICALNTLGFLQLWEEPEPARAALYPGYVEARAAALAAGALGVAVSGAGPTVLAIVFAPLYRRTPIIFNYRCFGRTNSQSLQYSSPRRSRDS
jgi:hypothetical protein